MRSALQRFWTGMVAAIAGAALALVVSILMVQAGKSVDVVLPTVEVLAGIGFILGVIFGAKKPR